MTMSYGSGHQLSQITDTAGRTYSVTYVDGRITRIAESTSGLSVPRDWEFTYTDGRLDTYKNPADQVTDYAYTNDEAQTGDSSQAQYLLSQITDPANGPGGSGPRPQVDLTYQNAQIQGVRYQQGNGAVGYDYDFKVGVEHSRCALPGKQDDPDFEYSTNVVSTDTTKGATTYCFRDRVNANDDGTGERTVRVVDGNGDKAKQDYSMDNQPTTFTAGANASDETGTGSTVASYGGGALADQLQSVTMPKDDGASKAATGTVRYEHGSNPPPGSDYLPTSSTDMNLVCTAYRYDATGRLTDTYIEQDPGANLDCSAQTGGKHYSQGYNNDGTVAWRQDPNGTTAKRNTYDYWQPGHSGYVAGTKGQLKREVRPGGDPACTASTSARLCTFYTYDDRARLVEMRDGRGVVTTYGYDALDRTTQVRTDGLTTPCTTVDTAAGVCVEYSYDAEGNMFRRDDVNGITTFDYDQLNRQRAVTTNDTLTGTPPLLVTRVGYDYNDDGKLTTLTQTENTAVVNKVAYGYDQANYPASATVNPDASDAADKLVVNLDQNKSGKHNKTVFASMSTPIELKKTYTTAGRLDTIEAFEQAATGNTRATLKLDYKRTVAGVPIDTNMIRSITYDKTGSSSLDGTVSYTYDGPNLGGKLASVSDTASGAPGYSYAFDGAGNVRRESKAGTPTWYGYDRAGQLCWSEGSDNAGADALVDSCDAAPAGATDYDQDMAGNSLGTTGDPYTYNDYNQASSIDGVTQKYRDLGNDMRVTNGNTRMVESSVGVISRTTSGTSTYYLHDPDGGILASYPSMNTSGYKANAVYYVTNHQDSVFMLLGSSGSRVGWYRYSPYGEPTIVNQTGTAATDNPWRYLSAYYSPENGGYHHLGARMYDNHSHFTQPDPERGDLSDPLHMLSYGYTAGDPINRNDAGGRWFWELVEAGYDAWSYYSNLEDFGVAFYDIADGTPGEGVEDLVESYTTSLAVGSSCAAVVILASGGIGTPGAVVCGLVGSASGEWVSRQG